MLSSRFKFYALVILFFCLSSAACTHSETQTNSITPPLSQVTQPVSVATKKNKLDYYVLALSWSPEYCKTHQQQQQSRQCNREPQQAYRFVLHGLWPSIDKTCTQERLSATVINSTLPFIPSKRLIEHEWEKHGRCSGYNPKQFFDLSIQAYEKIKIPSYFNAVNTRSTKKVSDLKKLMRQKNPHLKCDSIRVINVNKAFSELRICLDKSLQSINCPFPPKSNPNTEVVIVPPGM